MKRAITIFVAIIFATLTITSCGGKSTKSSNSGSSEKTKMTHRCGRTWDGKRDKTVGSYGDYCCEKCYVELYPN